MLSLKHNAQCIVSFIVSLLALELPGSKILWLLYYCPSLLSWPSLLATCCSFALLHMLLSWWVFLFTFDSFKCSFLSVRVKFILAYEAGMEPMNYLSTTLSQFWSPLFCAGPLPRGGFHLLGSFWKLISHNAHSPWISAALYCAVTFPICCTKQYYFISAVSAEGGVSVFPCAHQTAWGISDQGALTNHHSCKECH